MNWYLVLRFLHIASTIVFIGGIFARQLVRALAEKTEDVRIFAALSQAAGRIENVLIIPGNLAVIVFGLILALVTGAPILGFLQGASRNWLLVSNLLLAFGFLTVPLVFVPRGKKFDVVLKKALSEGRMSSELRAELDDKVIRFLHTLEIILVMCIVALMVFKPF
ncbi:MAG TPA: DUF2269 family protein [Anaerolineales bacterium]|nr:DUF2269 family protein [Anaerolineales bacterium]